MLMITTLRVMVVNLESNGDIREYCDIESEAAIRHIDLQFLLQFLLVCENSRNYKTTEFCSFGWFVKTDEIDKPDFVNFRLFCEIDCN